MNNKAEGGTQNLFSCGCFRSQNVIIIDMRLIFKGNLKNFRKRSRDSCVNPAVVTRNLKGYAAVFIGAVLKTAVSKLTFDRLQDRCFLSRQRIGAAYIHCGSGALLNDGQKGDDQCGA